MRAREFVTEQAQAVPAEIDGPLTHTYVIPGLNSDNPYRTYRFGLAVARARSDSKQDEINPYIEPWHPKTPWDQYAVVSGLTDDTASLIDQALVMTDVSGGKKAIGVPTSQEPATTQKQSPVRGFKGYPR